VEGVGTFLLTQGVLGVACLVLGFVVGKLYSKTEKQETKISDLQEARRVDAVATTEKVITVLQTNSQTNQLLAEKIEAAKQGSK
jgi:hypothetical protein